MKKEMRKQDLLYQVTIPNVDPLLDKKIKELIAQAIKTAVSEEAEVEYDPNNMTMMTDLYELTMGQVNFSNNEQDKIECYDLFFRTEPVDAGYGIMAGLEEIIDYIKHLHFTDEDIDYLRSLGKFSEGYLDYLRHLQFTGDLYAVPDGTPVFRNEPLITVIAPAIECKILETTLLSIINGAVSYATAASNITNTAEDKPVMEFGARRSFGPNAAMTASKYAVMGGCAGTSNVKSAKEEDTTAMGTQAHCAIMEASSEEEAFRAYAKAFPDKPLLLVDTYNTIEGIKKAIKVCKELNIKLGGVRIDSGDLAKLSKEARKMLDEAGYPDAKICISNGLNAPTIESIKQQKTPFNLIGSGDNITSYPKRVGPVYKLSGIMEDGKMSPRLKISGDRGKTTNPGQKTTYRFFDKETGQALGDVIALSDENIPDTSYTFVDEFDKTNRRTITNYTVRPLQKQIFRKGELVYSDPTLSEKKAYCTKEKLTLSEEVRRPVQPQLYSVHLSDNLRELKEKLIAEGRGYEEDKKVYVKRKNETV